MDSSNQILKIYPSGFLGSANVIQTEPIDMIVNVKNLLNRTRVNKSTPYTANQEVVLMWEDALMNSKEFKSFEYKEKILVLAMKAFGTRLIKHWIDAQVDNVMCGDTHYRWIDETLMYVMVGSHRSFQYNTWLTVLSTARPDTEAKGYSKVMYNFFGNGKPSVLVDPANNPRNMTVVDFLRRWVSQENGIEDLAASLNVLFGKR